MPRDAPLRIVQALNEALAAPKSYDDLCNEQTGVWSALTEADYIKSTFPELTPEQRFSLIKVVLKSVDTALYKKVYGENRSNRVPESAFAVVRHAIEFLLESGPSGRTMVAYRNRHHKFIDALAAFADEAHGRPLINNNYYQGLGRKIATYVLEENVGDFGMAQLSPAEWQHDAITESALSKIVYFVGSASGPIKIGIAANPSSRLASLQTAHYEKLSILALVQGDIEVERAYHNRFSGYRLTGEWFERHPELLAEIDKLNSVAPILPIGEHEN